MALLKGSEILADDFKYVRTKLFDEYRRRIFIAAKDGGGRVDRDGILSAWRYFLCNAEKNLFHYTKGTLSYADIDYFLRNFKSLSSKAYKASKIKSVVAGNDQYTLADQANNLISLSNYFLFKNTKKDPITNTYSSNPAPEGQEYVVKNYPAQATQLRAVNTYLNNMAKQYRWKPNGQGAYTGGCSNICFGLCSGESTTGSGNSCTSECGITCDATCFIGCDMSCTTTCTGTSWSEANNEQNVNFNANVTAGLNNFDRANDYELTYYNGSGIVNPDSSNNKKQKWKALLFNNRL